MEVGFVAVLLLLTGFILATVGSPNKWLTVDIDIMFANSWKVHCPNCLIRKLIKTTYCRFLFSNTRDGQMQSKGPCLCLILFIDKNLNWKFIK